MQPYPNYWINPMQYQQHVNPYADQLSQLRMMQQAPAQNMYHGLSGRIVDDFNVITANDVPMDGNGAIFIKRDGSEIQVRNWTANGTISTNAYKPVLNTIGKEVSTSEIKIDSGASESVTAILQEYLDKFNKRFDELEKKIIPEVTSNE